MPDMLSPKDSGEFFAQVAVKENLLTPEQGDLCLRTLKLLKSSGEDVKVEEIVIDLGMLTQEEARRIKRTKDYLKSRQEDVILARRIISDNIANETDVQFALTLQDALFLKEKEHDVPRLIDLLLEDRVIGREEVTSLLETLSRIREAIENNDESILEDPSVEFELPPNLVNLSYETTSECDDEETRETGADATADTTSEAEEQAEEPGQPAAPGEAEEEETGAPAEEAQDDEAVHEEATEAPESVTESERTGEDHGDNQADESLPVDSDQQDPVENEKEQAAQSTWTNASYARTDQDEDQSVSELSTLFKEKLGLSSGERPGDKGSGTSSAPETKSKVSISSWLFASVRQDVNVVPPAPRRSQGEQDDNKGSERPQEVRPINLNNEDEEDPVSLLAPQPPRRVVKRKHPRFKVKDATVHFAGDGLFSTIDLLEKPAHIINMSAGGLCMLTRRPLAIGERIKLLMHIPSLREDLSAKGEVRSCKTLDKHTQHFHVGVMFLKLSPHVRNLIQELARDPVLRGKGKFRRYT